MIGRYLLPLIAVGGVAIIIAAVIIDNRPVPVARAAITSPEAPFPAYVAATGVVEAGGGNIAVGTPVSGIVTETYVTWGEHVNAGDRLFKIDDRDLRAQLLPALAEVSEGKTRLEQARSRLALAERVTDERAISVEEVNERRFAVAIAAAAAGLASAKARVDRIRLDMERHTVRAPVPGRILQITIRPGEFAQSGALTAPLMLLGGDTRLFLRVDADEFDAWRIRAGAPGVAFVRGNPNMRTTLQFERIDPYVIPKTSLTGSSTERVDTRVLQVIYSFDPSTLPDVYVGQQLDVFIQAPPLNTPVGTGIRRGQ